MAIKKKEKTDLKHTTTSNNPNTRTMTMAMVQQHKEVKQVKE